MLVVLLCTNPLIKLYHITTSQSESSIILLLPKVTLESKVTTVSTFCMLSKLFLFPLNFMVLLHKNRYLFIYLLSHCTVQKIEKEAITA